MDRRTLVLGGTAVAASAVAGVVGAGAAAGIGRALGGAKAPKGSATTALPSTTTSVASGPTTTGATSAGTRIGLASQVPVGGAASFQDPATGNPGLVLQLTKGQFVAYDAICPHAGCTVGYSEGAKLIVCPCHGSEFEPSSGNVLSPPASRGLTPINVTLDSSGQLLADG
jgi:thiosulfate dehydrogenase [quinone] large subunit